MSDAIRTLENETIYILRQTYRRHPRMALLWSMGKDSTTVLWLARKAFFGKLPFPVLHIDTSYKFPEMYAYRDEIAAEWGFELLVHRNEEALANGMCSTVGTKLACCTALKTEALKQAVTKFGYEALLLGIRGDEHAVRGKERIVSPRRSDFGWQYQNQPPELWDVYDTATHADWQHLRIHPILRWREVDVWSFVERERMPLVDLYFAKNGQRYRSIGCKTCCAPVTSGASGTSDVLVELRTTHQAERAGRAQDKEDAATMQKLRALGYM